MYYDPYPWLAGKYARAKQQDARLDQDIDAALADHSIGMSRARSGVHYPSETARLAYALSHLALTAAFVSQELGNQSLKGFPDELTMFRAERLEVLSLGCGPGSDLLGALHALKATPRQIVLRAVDREAAWRPWVEEAVTQARAGNLALAAAKVDVLFEQCDLSNLDATRSYLASLKDNGPSVMLMSRVFGAIPHPEAFVQLLVEVASEHTTLVVIEPPPERALLEVLKSLLEQSPRRGTVLGAPDRILGIDNHRLDFGPVLQQLDATLTHHLERGGPYVALRYLMDTASTLRLPAGQGDAPAR